MVGAKPASSSGSPEAGQGASDSPRKFSIGSHPVREIHATKKRRSVNFNLSNGHGDGSSNGARKRKKSRSGTGRAKGARRKSFLDLFNLLSHLFSLVSFVETLHGWVIYVAVGFVGVMHEITKNACRETIRQCLRFTNSIPAFFISLVDDRFFWRKMRRAYNKGHGEEGAWRQFWATSMHRPSSFNALFDLDETQAKDQSSDREARRRGGRAKPRSKAADGESLGPIREGRSRSFRSRVTSRLRTALLSIWGVRTLLPLFQQAKQVLVMPEKLLRPSSGSDRVLFQSFDGDVSGFLEDVSVNTQILIDRYFSFLEGATRLMLWDFSFLSGKVRAYWRQYYRRPQGKTPESPPRPGRIKRSPSLMVLKASIKPRKSKYSIRDTIKGAGYPFEQYSVETEDGYYLDLYRIPRVESKDVVMFQHGMMDSAYGWVMRGDESAIAFAAYDCGQDVFLANFRGAPPRSCKEEVSGKYWKYTFNELGMFDMAAVVEKIHRVKEEERSEMENTPRGSGSPGHKLRVVGHSLGGAALQIYLATARLLGRDPGVHRMILLSPAGRHDYFLPLLAQLLCLTDTLLGFWLKRLNVGMTVYGVTMRVGARKFAVDVSSLPGLKGIFDIIFRIFFGGDKSFGEILPSYMSPYIQSMPGICWGIVRHGHQCVKSKTFSLYDYESDSLNIEHYGRATPPLVSEVWGQDGGILVPIDFCAGKADGVVPAKCVYQQYLDLKARGASVSYREFDLGHLGFIHNPSEEFTSFLLSRLSIE